MPSQVMLINVEVVATPYIREFKRFHHSLDSSDSPLPHDFFESALSAAFDQKEKTNYRYPRIDLFSSAHRALFDDANLHINPTNPILITLTQLAARYDYHVAFIFDQHKKQGNHVAQALCAWIPHSVAYFADQSVLGKPEPHLYVRAIKHFNVQPNHALVIDSTRNGISAAHLAHARSIYLDNGLGFSERICKYSTYQAATLEELTTLIHHLNS